MNVGWKNFLPLPPKGRPLGTSKTIGAIILGFKSGVTKWMWQNNPIHDGWQRNFYDHIIRNANSMDRIREYINRIPLKWDRDELNRFNHNQKNKIK